MSKLVYNITENNSKYFINFANEITTDELEEITKEINEILRPYESKAFVIGDKIEMHLQISKLEDQIHLIEKKLKEK